jgi:hypothetical protein
MPSISQGTIFRRKGTRNWSIKFYLDGHVRREATGTVAPQCYALHPMFVSRDTRAPLVPWRFRARLTGKVVMSKAAVVLLSVAVAGIALVISARACTCRPKSLEGCWRAADAVFSGFVLSVRETTYAVPFSITGKVATIEIRRAWKGVVTDTVVSVTTGSGGGDCGFPFRRMDWRSNVYTPGNTVLLFAHRVRVGSAFATSLCDGGGYSLGKPLIAALDSLEAAARVEAPSKPSPPENSSRK